MFIEDEEEARVLFQDAVEHMGIHIAEQDITIYDLAQALAHDHIEVTKQFNLWLADQTVHNPNNNLWTVTN